MKKIRIKKNEYRKIYYSAVCMLSLASRSFDEELVVDEEALLLLLVFVLFVVVVVVLALG